ncbi:SpoIIE family protein phosphatase, partial [Verrucomicrobiota bacterium]
KIVSTGNFDNKIEVRSHDEMRDLAGAFNQMVLDLKKYTEDLARATAERERIQSELRFAREVQQGILPKVFPPFARADNVEIFARMEPAREVGGDYYDFFLIDKDHIGVVIADVSGKGVSAGLFMMVVRTLLRNNALANLSAADAITKTNALLASDNPSAMFVTVFYFVCDMRTGKVTFCNAGHNPPFWLRKNKKQVDMVEQGPNKGVVVGVLEDASYSDSELVLAEGESLVLYTDGVTEPVDTSGEMYGEERLISRIEANADLPNNEICNRIYEDVSRHQEGLEQFDDITLLFFKFLGNGLGSGECGMRSAEEEVTTNEHE